MPQKTSEILDKEVDDWCMMLWGEVPIDRLDECFKIAYRGHIPGKIFEAAAVLRAWDSLKAGGVSPVANNYSCTLCRAHLENSSVAPCPFHQSRMIVRNTTDA